MWRSLDFRGCLPGLLKLSIDTDDFCHHYAAAGVKTAAVMVAVADTAAYFRVPVFNGNRSKSQIEARVVTPQHRRNFAIKPVVLSTKNNICIYKVSGLDWGVARARRGEALIAETRAACVVVRMSVEKNRPSLSDSFNARIVGFRPPGKLDLQSFTTSENYSHLPLPRLNSTDILLGFSS